MKFQLSFAAQVVVGLLVMVQNVLLCPTGCKCKHTLASCQDLKLTTENLTSLARNLPENTIVLYLGFNQIESFPSHLFSKLRQLRELHLRSNFLTRVPDNSKMYFPSLVELDLEENQIDDISKESFRGYANVTTLNLRQNKIKILPGKTFQEMTKLRYLYIQTNFIEKIDQDTFYGLKGLLYLSLAENRIKSIAENSFDGQRTLKQLMLHSNLLEVVPNNLISKSSRIHMIDLSTNQIRNLSEFSFSNMKNVAQVEIVLHGNVLESIPLSSFKLSKRLTIHLSQNILKCNCELLATYKRLTRPERQIMISNAECVSPTKMKDRMLSTVSETELDCDPCQVYDCLNNGRCVSENGKAKCLCLDQYEGTFCDRSKSNPTKQVPVVCLNQKCVNNSTCIAINKTEYVCRCLDGYLGKYCRETDEEDTLSLPTLIAIIGACALVLIIAITLGICLCRKKKVTNNNNFLLDEEKTEKEEKEEKEENV